MLLYLYQEKQIKGIKVKKSLKFIWILKILLLYLKCKTKGRYKKQLKLFRTLWCIGEPYKTL